MDYLNFKYIFDSVLYSVLGIGLLVVAFLVVERLAPRALSKEIIEEHNVALAVVVGAFILAVAIIVSSAIHG